MIAMLAILFAGAVSGQVYADSVLVELHQSVGTIGGIGLFYRVGDVSTETNAVEWSDSRRYDRGQEAAVARGGNILVEAHSGLRQENIYYHVGFLDAVGKTVTWSKTDADKTRHYGSGWTPDLVLIDETVVMVYGSDNGVWFRTGRLDTLRKDIEWLGRQQMGGRVHSWQKLAAESETIVHVFQVPGKDRYWMDLNYRIGEYVAEQDSLGWSVEVKYDR